jgi:protein-arginine kinase activator protein McsA
LKKQLDDAIAAREFEQAAVIRDQIKEISWE